MRSITVYTGIRKNRSQKTESHILISNSYTKLYVNIGDGICWARSWVDNIYELSFRFGIVAHIDSMK